MAMTMTGFELRASGFGLAFALTIWTRQFKPGIYYDTTDLYLGRYRYQNLSLNWQLFIKPASF